MKEVIEELKKMQKESMALKLQIKDDIHSMDKRLVKMEVQWKLMVPFVTIIFTMITSFVKTKLLGMKV